MFKRIALTLILLFTAAAAHAQTQTSVTATVTDPSGLPYANGTYSIQLVPSTGTPTVTGNLIGGAFNGRLDSTGTLNVVLWANASIVPSGTKWQFTVCVSPSVAPPLGTGGQCTPPTSITISGTSQNVSSTLSAVAPALTAFLGTSLPGGIGTVKLNVTSAQLKAMPGTPVPILPAPGPNQVIQVLAYTFQYRFVTPAYTIGNANNQVVFVYHGQTSAIGLFLGVQSATGFFDQSVNEISTSMPGAVGSIAQTATVGLGVDLTIEGTTPALTLGNGTLEIVIMYMVVDLS